MFGGNGGSWSVQKAVPLKCIFFLNKAQYEQVLPLGAGESVGMLASAAEQQAEHYKCKDQRVLIHVRRAHRRIKEARSRQGEIERDPIPTEDTTQQEIDE